MVFSKSSLKLRWLILALASFVLLFTYYTYDLPSALQSQMDEYFTNPLSDHGQTLDQGSFALYFSLLYTCYSIPNVVLPFFGGILLDKIGTRIMIISLCCLVFIGQLTVATVKY